MDRNNEPEIVWEEVGGGDYRGKVGGRIVAVIIQDTWTVPDDKFYTSIFNDSGMTKCDTLEAAKSRASELLKEWMEEAGLMVKPTSDHKDCHMRKMCKAYNPVPICRKVRSQGCFEDNQNEPQEEVIDGT